MLVNSVVATPFANYVRAQAMILGHGICGICVDSINMLSNANIHSHALLAHMLTAQIIGGPDDLTLYEICLNPGPITLKDIYSQVKRVRVNLDKSTKSPIFQATGTVRFHVVIGRNTIKNPLTEDMIRNFVAQKNLSNSFLIPSVLPFLTVDPIKYEIEDVGNGFSEVTFDNLSEEDVQEILREVGESLVGK